MTDTNTQGQSSGLLTVKTMYARIAIILLALNFVLTGYVIASMQKAQNEQQQTPARGEETQTATQVEGGTQ